MRQPRLQFGNRQQRGFVLVVCLVILLVLTVLGVNNMGTGNLEERMASNSQSKLTTFQNAESAIEETYDGGVDVDAVISNTALTVTHTYNYSGKTATTTTRFISDNSANATSSNLNCFVGPLVEIQGDSSSAGTGAQSRLVLGVTKIAPEGC